MNLESNGPNWVIVQPAGGERVLPVYMLLDTSGSMEGPRLASVWQGREQFQTEIARDQFARDAMKVGLITFDSDAELYMRRLVPAVC